MNAIKRMMAIALVLVMIHSIFVCAVSAAESLPDEKVSNLALGKVTMASGVSDFSKENAVDGSTSTRWAHEVSSAWISVDLVSLCELEKLEIEWENDTIDMDYSIQFSNDNEEWSEAITGKKVGVSHSTIVLDGGVTARYVKVSAKVTKGYPSVSIRELEIWGVAPDTSPPQKELNLDPANIALGKVATAYKSPINYWGPDKLTDGIVNRNADKPNQSRWSSESGALGWVAIDLKQQQVFDRLTLEWEQKVVEDYHIEVSDDNQTWSTVYTAAKNTEGYPFTDQVILKNPVTARYVKLTIDKLIQGAYPSLSLYEIKIWAPDVSSINKALGKTASASKDDGTHKPNFAVDGIINRDANRPDQSRWASEPQGKGAWFMVDLGVPLDFNRLALDWETTDIKTDFHIEMSNDNKTWETVLTAGAREYALHEEFMLSAMCNARYVRLVADKVDGYPSVSFYEFGLYQDLDFVSAIDKVKEQLKDISLKPEDTQLLMPAGLSSGVEVTYSGTDYEQIIDANRKIHKPLVDTEVAVEFKTKFAGGKETELYEVKLTVPGIYDSAQSKNDKPKVLPELQQWFGHEGDFTIGSTSKIVLNPALGQAFQDMAQAFAADYKEITGNAITVVTGTAPAAGDFYFKASTEELDKETYDMEIGESVTVSASDSVGAFWSTRTILQILKRNGTTIPKGLVRDYPLYEVRGFMLDVGRKAIPLDFLKMWVKQMSWYKMNDFNLHLSDEAFDLSYWGFRLESNIPKLTSTDIYYTKDEFRQLQIESKAQGVSIVPEFDTPGHATAYTHARPDLARPGNRSYLDVQNPDSLKFIKEVFAEYMEEENPVFLPDTVVHIGTDEYKGGSQAEKEAFRVYQDELLKFIRDDMHRTPRVWGSQTENSGATQITVEGVQMYMWYPGYANPKAMYDLGYKMINIHDGNVYIVPGVGYYSDYLSKSNILNNWKPNNVMGMELPAGDPQVMGGSYALWNDETGDKHDNGTTDVEMFDRMFDILPTFSERLWSSVKDYTVADIDALTAQIKYAPGTNPTYDVKSKVKAVLSYTFGEGKEKADASSNGYNIKDDSVNAAFVEGRDGQALQLKGGESYVETPVDNMRINSTLDFWVKRAADDDDTEKVLFESDIGAIKTVQKGTGKVGFSRDFRDYSFNYTLPKGEWVRLTLVTEYTKTTLYVNGTKVHTLEKTKQGGNKWASLITPLTRIGSKTSAFRGEIDSVALYNFAAKAEQLNNLPEPISIYTVTFKTNGGSTVNAATVKDGEKVAKPADPTKSGYTFVGWYTDMDLTQAYDFDTEATKDLIVYAKWEVLGIEKPDAPTAKDVTITLPAVDAAVGQTLITISTALEFRITNAFNVEKQVWTLGAGKAQKTSATSALVAGDKIEVRVKETETTPASEIYTYKVIADEIGKAATVATPPFIPGTKLEGELTLASGQSGTVSLNKEMTIAIPSEATDKMLHVVLKKITDPSALVHKQEALELISSVIEVTNNLSEGLKKSAELTLLFDTSKLVSDSKAQLFVYDEVKKEWMEIGGDVCENTVTAQVDRFGTFAVFAVKSADESTEVPFLDVHKHWAEESIQQAVELGFIKGYQDGTFRPNADITRAEFIVILTKALKLQGSGQELNFSDNADIDPWATQAISQAVEAGIINGYTDGTFRPNAKISRTEMVLMAVRALKLNVEAVDQTSFKDDSKIPQWAKASVEAAVKDGLVNGVGANTFAPNHTATRAESVTMLLKAIKLHS